MPVVPLTNNPRIMEKGVISSYTFIWFDIGSGVMIVQNEVSVFAGNQAWPRPSVIGSELALNVRQSESDL